MIETLLAGASIALSWLTSEFAAYVAIGILAVVVLWHACGWVADRWQTWEDSRRPPPEPKQEPTPEPEQEPTPAPEPSREDKLRQTYPGWHPGMTIKELNEARDRALEAEPKSETESKAEETESGAETMPAPEPTPNSHPLDELATEPEPEQQGELAALDALAPGGKDPFAP